MKFILISVMVLLSYFVNADEIEGVWAFSGVGCRDESLSVDSHKTKPTTSNTAGLSEAVLYLERNAQAKIVAVLHGEKETRTADYSVRGNEIVFKYRGGEDSVFLVENRIIIISEDEDEAKNCRRDEVFVFVLAKVS